MDHKLVLKNLLMENSNIENLIVAPHASIIELCTKMKDLKTNLLVVRESATIVGVVSVRDIVRKAILKKLDFEKTQVHEIMISNISSTNPNASIKSMIDLLRDRQCRHLPIITFEGELMGIVTDSSILKCLIA